MTPSRITAGFSPTFDYAAPMSCAAKDMAIAYLQRQLTKLNGTRDFLTYDAIRADTSLTQLERSQVIQYLAALLHVQPAALLSNEKFQKAVEAYQKNHQDKALGGRDQFDGKAGFKTLSEWTKEPAPACVLRIEIGVDDFPVMMTVPPLIPITVTPLAAPSAALPPSAAQLVSVESAPNASPARGVSVLPHHQRSEGGWPTGVLGQVHTDQPLVALTFDDGPHPTHTVEILAALKARGMKATFFLLETEILRHPDIVRQIVAEGHAVGMHDINHMSWRGMSPETVVARVIHVRDTLLALTGTSAIWVRPPYGAINSAQVAALAKAGFRVACWTSAGEEGPRRIIHGKKQSPWLTRPLAIQAKIATATNPGSILLLHDVRSGTAAAVPGILEDLLSRHITSVTLSELENAARPAIRMAVAPPGSTAGKDG